MDNSYTQKVYEKVPPIHYASAFFQLSDLPEWNLRSEDSQKKVQKALHLFRMKELWGSKKVEPILFDLEEKRTDIYSPHYAFVWEATTWFVSFVVSYDHPKNSETISENLLPMINDEWIREWEVWLHNDFMRKWKNTYTFEVIDTTWKKKNFTKIIDSNHEEIFLWNAALYVDPYNKVDGKNVVWFEDDFDWIPTWFLTNGCIDWTSKVVIKYENEYSTIPACLSYSTKKWYLIYFDNKRELDGKYTYTIKSPDHGILYSKFPLYQWRRSSLYQSLVYFNPWGNFLQIVKATWDIQNYETLIQHYDVRNQRNTMSLRQINWEQVEIENWYEKLIVYYYKQNESIRRTLFPWLRYKYYVLRSWSRRLINQWNVYHLDEQVHIPPTTETWSVFRLDARLYWNEIVIEDPFMHITYNITSLKKEASIVQKPKDEFNCDTATLGIYWTTAVSKDFVYENDDIRLLWSWWDVDSVVLEDNNWSTYDVEQHTLWYIAARIEPDEKWTAKWNTIFTLKWLNASWRDVCKKTVSVDILELPEY